MGRNSFKMDIKDAAGFIDRLDTLSESAQQKLPHLVKAAAYDLNDDAISNIQSAGAVDLGAGGGLLAGQAVREIDEWTVEVVNSSKHAPFVEWGTGKRVSVPNEWDQYAAQYKGPYPGTWQEFKQNIRAWMKRHGIPETEEIEGANGKKMTIDVVGRIMTSILAKGLKPRPFLYPAFVENRKKLIGQFKKLFKQ